MKRIFDMGQAASPKPTVEQQKARTVQHRTLEEEQRLAFIKDEFRCLHNCEICGKCSFLKGREAEEIYKDYIISISCAVSLMPSLKSSMPITTAVTGSKAPRISVGVEPMI